ncbi:hypothetical protein QUF80_02835 [Desulfococcaceae bacterium HSG8]|nr:hypothetical protein [Desulfococcaceae bacterium HSG8]
MKRLETFNPTQIEIVNTAVAMSEELVSNFYKMSASQWLRLKYDIKTLTDLCQSEIVQGAFAQVIRYEGRRKDRHLTSSTYDFYKICIQDHSILSALERSPVISLLPFALYIVSHELIHIVRFSKFLQNFDASPTEKMAEETRVHENTHEILITVRIPGLEEVLNFYNKWRLTSEFGTDGPGNSINKGKNHLSFLTT